MANVKSLLNQYAYKHGLKLGNICSGKDPNPFPVSKSTIERAMYKHNLKFSTLKKLIDFLEMDLKGDPIVNRVLKKYEDRSAAGIKKYNTMLTRDDLSTRQWLIHLQEELMDATLYIETLLNKKEVFK